MFYVFSVLVDGKYRGVGMSGQTEFVAKEKLLKKLGLSSDIKILLYQTVPDAATCTHEEFLNGFSQKIGNDSNEALQEAMK